MAYKNPDSEENIAKMKASKKKHYEANKIKYHARNTAKKAEIRAFIAEYKVSHGCLDCGGSFPSYVLDLDHRDPSTKLVTPSRLVAYMSWDKVHAELEKCDVVCANCHRIRTQEGQHYLRRKQPPVSPVVSTH